jgi:hypothetical protein
VSTEYTLLRNGTSLGNARPQRLWKLSGRAGIAVLGRPLLPHSAPMTVPVYAPLRCTSRVPFAPSLALWQCFVASHTSRRFSSLSPCHQQETSKGSNRPSSEGIPPNTANDGRQQFTVYPYDFERRTGKWLRTIVETDPPTVRAMKMAHQSVENRTPYEGSVLYPMGETISDRTEPWYGRYRTKQQLKR